MDSSSHPVSSAERPVDSLEAPIPAPVPALRATAPQPHLVRTFGADTIGSLQSLLGTIVIAVFVITFIVQAFQIPSQSMENTLLVGDYLLVDKLVYGGRSLGDHL